MSLNTPGVLVNAPNSAAFSGVNLNPVIESNRSGEPANVTATTFFFFSSSSLNDCRLIPPVDLNVPPKLPGKDAPPPSIPETPVPPPNCCADVPPVPDSPVVNSIFPVPGSNTCCLAGAVGVGVDLGMVPELPVQSLGGSFILA